MLTKLIGSKARALHVLLSATLVVLGTIDPIPNTYNRGEKYISKPGTATAYCSNEYAISSLIGLNGSCPSLGYFVLVYRCIFRWLKSMSIRV